MDNVQKDFINAPSSRNWYFTYSFCLSWPLFRLSESYEHSLHSLATLNMITIEVLIVQ
jgi:hypothetical protein